LNNLKQEIINVKKIDFNKEYLDNSEEQFLYNSIVSMHKVPKQLVIAQKKEDEFEKQLR